MTDKLDEAKKEFADIPEKDDDKPSLPAEDKVKRRSKKQKLLTEAERLKKKISDELTDKEDLKADIELKKSGKNQIIAAIKFLSDNYDFRYNDILKQTEVKRKKEEKYEKLDDLEFHDMVLDICLAGIQIGEDKFKHIIYGTMVAKRYNPLTEYMFSLPRWDGKTDYIKDYCNLLELDDEEKRPFVEVCFAKWVVGMVGSVVNPLEVNHLCLVLVGGQGTGKTTFLNNLVPAHLKREYLYSNTFLPHSKDHILFLASKLLINLDEMEVFNKTDIRTIKSVITQPQVELRKAYAKESLIGTRIASFCGSVNNVEFLNDDTGSRRFLPIHVKKVNFTQIKSLDLMYAQALALYKDDTFIHYITHSELQHLEVYNDEFKMLTMEEEMCLKHFRRPTEQEIKEHAPCVSYYHPNEIVGLLCKKYEKLNHNNTVKNFVGRALTKHGFNKVSKRLTGYDKPVKVWEVVHQDNELKELDGSELINKVNNIMSMI
jgi:predicted P-loop ATPase